jgi:hypothetical protein
MLKTQGTSWTAGHIEVNYDAPHATINFYTFTAPNTWQAFGALSGVTFAAGDQFGARAFSDGRVQAFRNGALLGTVSVAGWPYAALGGRIGLSAVNATASRFDDFGGGDISGTLALLAPTGAAVQAASLPVAPRPTSLELSAPIPNPSSGGVVFSLQLPSDHEVRLSVLDVQGRVMWSGPPRNYSAGRWTLVWDGRSAGGRVPPGVYLARVRVGSQSLLRRIAIIR